MTHGGFSLTPKFERDLKKKKRKKDKIRFSAQFINSFLSESRVEMVTQSFLTRHTKKFRLRQNKVQVQLLNKARCRLWLEGREFNTLPFCC